MDVDKKIYVVVALFYVDYIMVRDGCCCVLWCSVVLMETSPEMK